MPCRHGKVRQNTQTHNHFLFSKGQSKGSLEATTICVMSASEPVNPPGISKTVGPSIPTCCRSCSAAQVRLNPCEPYLNLGRLRVLVALKYPKVIREIPRI